MSFSHTHLDSYSREDYDLFDKLIRGDLTSSNAEIAKMTLRNRNIQQSTTTDGKGETFWLIKQWNSLSLIEEYVRIFPDDIVKGT